MAAGEHSCTRRALLGAAVAVPLAAASSSPSPSGGGQGGGVRTPGVGDGVGAPSPQPSPGRGEGAYRRWARAVAGVERAEGEMAAFSRAEAAMGARSFAAQWELDEAFSDLVVGFNDALRRLMHTPAPNLPALAAKIALAVDHDVATLSGGERCMAALKRDSKRLCAAPTPSC